MLEWVIWAGQIGNPKVSYWAVVALLVFVLFRWLGLFDD